MSCNTILNTYPDNIYAYISVSGPPQPVPLCVLIVIGPEVKTQNRCRHL